MWFAESVLLPKIAQCGAAWVIAIFKELPSFIRSASTKVDAKHWFHVGLLTPVHKLVRAELVCFGVEPGKVDPFRSAFHGTNTIFPVITREKIATWIPHDCWAKFFDEIQDILAESIFIRSGVARFKNASVHAPAPVLHKGAEQSTVELSNGEVFIQNNAQHNRFTGK